ncbi:hypothetical protein EXIGLDRAFT_696637 [Exidia glandulosa HHB12029]|uniref:Uncharacterized protein n=1 Tax=Exidia glandulosa HHB12029 TaxID=1314781 RepID=A0A165F6C1_EXIGL|nr:hypothetical protein EXIGLDRAFT_696637 [Exidia glandulosa HHB12029]
MFRHVVAAFVVLFCALLFANRNIGGSFNSTTMTHLLAPTISGSVRSEFSIVIAAPVEKLIDAQKKPLPTSQQVLVQGSSILVGMQLSPTLDPSVKPQDAVELIISVDAANRRWAYRSHSTGPIFRAERSFAVSPIDERTTLFEMRDVIGGVVGRAAGWWFGGKMTLIQEEMAKALKKRAESMS